MAMKLPEDITDYEAVVTEVLGDMAAKHVDEPAVVVNWVAVTDLRLTNGGWATAVLAPKGQPPWLNGALMEHAEFINGEGATAMGNGGEEWGDENESA